jgi:1-acyl-sn-glycerol-3-phosphate acyltransferase
MLRGIMRMLCGVILMGRLHVEGEAHIPKSGGVLIVGNHVGTIDPPLAGAVIRRSDVYFMAKSEHFSTRLKRWLFNGYHAFPVVRGTADRSALRHSLDLLGRGRILVLYPEGTRGPALRKAHAGAGFLAQRGGVPVVPMAVWGTEDVLPKGSTLPRRAHVHVRFGEPFTLPERLRNGDHDHATDYMMAKIAELLPQRYRGIYSGRGDQATVA